jgi:hypothetical protein
MVRATPLRPAIAPLPATAEGILALAPQRNRSIIDQVEDIHRMLLANAVYRKLIDVVFNEHAVEGNIAANHYKAAMMLQDKAKSLDANHPVAKANWGTLKAALKRVLTRGGISPKQRKAAAYVPHRDSTEDSE